ncbi:MAG: sugar phosphate isomerase/epimerase [Clostridiales Family XIII bacterium]|jgi:sugar phosphate isomerase/epimerase|nr:sugar phosphate isomerase/epimerase [Clostridiales Family XIII bacterium]
MKVGIDSYCYHRYFGEVYPEQDAPEKNLTIYDFLDRAKFFGAEAVSLETCFLPSLDKGFLSELKTELDKDGFDRVFAWGHPDGLERGKNQEAFLEMKSLIPMAPVVGAKVMRVTGSSLMFRHENHQEQLKLLSEQFKEAMKIADEYDVKLAVENHIDFTSDEILQLLEMVDNKSFGVNFDTGNFLRLLDDPVAGMKKLAPYVMATHCKDLQVNLQAKPTDWFFFSGVPVGLGLVDNQSLVNELYKVNYDGFLAVEIDQTHPDWKGFEDEAVSISVKNMKKMRDKAEGR